MSADYIQPHPCGHFIHSAPNLYILVRYQSTKVAPDYCLASCEFLDDTDPTKGKGLATYLSLFDAYLAAAFSCKPGEQWRVLPASSFDPRDLIDANYGQLHYFVHFGWAAADRKIFRRTQGGLASVYALDTIQSDQSIPLYIEIHIPDEDLAHYVFLREQAGLFAHKEHDLSFALMDEQQRLQQVSLAIAALPAQHAVGTVSQLAFYDFNFAQWLFVPIEKFNDFYKEGGIS